MKKKTYYQLSFLQKLTTLLSLDKRLCWNQTNAPYNLSMGLRLGLGLGLGPGLENGNESGPVQGAPNQALEKLAFQ